MQREIESDLQFFKEKFIIPVDDAIITGVYGSQRILNGIPKWPHYGLDFAQKKGTPIKAMNNGIVTLAEKDLFYTGATLIFDHGHGVSTLYMHMDEIFVNVGDHVKKGDIIATVGSSGRSTGPHLDVRLNWFGTRLDPATILKHSIMKKTLLEKSADKLVNAFVNNKIIAPLPAKIYKKIR